MTAKFNGLLLSSTQPDAMRAWYQSALARECDEHGVLALGDIQLIFETHDEITGPTREPARVMINFEVDDAHGFARHLDKVGATWIRKVEEAPFGLIATVADPDGNLVQFVELNTTR